MKAAVGRRYGAPEVLRIEEIPVPDLGPDEVRVRVEATSVTSGDVKLRNFRNAGGFWLPLRLMFGLLRPRQPVTGMEFAGSVDEAGENVTEFKSGDPVFGMVLRGANAEYIVLPANAIIVRRPDDLCAQRAAGVPFGALAALAFLRDFAKIKPGEHIAVVGASGAVGVFAIQLAKLFGATVTAVCSGRNAALVADLGADRVVDYQREDFTRHPGCYDVVLDTQGVTSFTDCRRVLAARGRHVFVSAKLHHFVQSLWTSIRPGKRVVCGFSMGSRTDLEAVTQLVAGGVLRPVIDRQFELCEVVAAHRLVEAGHKRGAVVLNVS